MSELFKTMRLPAARDAVAPDGSDVRVLLGLKGGGMTPWPGEGEATVVQGKWQPTVP